MVETATEIGIATELLNLLVVFAVAVGVRVLIEKVVTIPYTVLLVFTGFGISLLGLTLPIDLSHDLIFFIFLPAILFQGAEEIDFQAFRENLPVSVPMVLIGLPTAIVLFGWSGTYAFGLPLLVSLLFAAMIYPIDPVAVLSLYREMDAPERLSVLTESESLMDDGLAIVIFTTLLGLVRETQQTPQTVDGFFTLARFSTILAQFIFVSVGGILVGSAVGYLVPRVMKRIDDKLTKLLLAVIIAYGSFLLAEEVFRVNGILATVAAGLYTGTVGMEHGLQLEEEEFLTGTRDAVVFLFNTVLFLLIGIEVNIGDFMQQLQPIILATLLVLGVRAVAVYVITGLVNQVVSQPVPLNYRHVLVWGGMHAAIPVALALSLPPGIPFRDQLQTMVFGVVFLSIVVQGILMPFVLRVTGVVDSETSHGSQV